MSAKKITAESCQGEVIEQVTRAVATAINPDVLSLGDARARVDKQMDVPLNSGEIVIPIDGVDKKGALNAGQFTDLVAQLNSALDIALPADMTEATTPKELAQAAQGELKKQGRLIEKKGIDPVPIAKRRGDQSRFDDGLV